MKTAKRIEQVEEYYFSRKLAEVRSLDTADWPVINLGIGSPDLAPPPAVVEALWKSARNPAHHGYQNYKGILPLRQAIAEFEERIFSVSLNPEKMILPLIGSKEGIMHITMAFVNEGDEVLIPDPGYPTYGSVSRLAGAKVRTYHLDASNGWRLDIDSLRAQDLSKVKLMWVNYPHMPTGKTATRADLLALVALARENGFLLVHDNPYSLILNDHPMSILAIPGADGVAIELNSLSKSHNMAGWRIGWAAGHPDLIDAVIRVKTNMDSGMFLGLQHAAVEALRLGPEWFNELNTVYRGRRELAKQILDELGCSYDEHQSGLFLWAAAPDGTKDVEKWLDEILYGARVFLTPGMVFGENGKGHVRVSLCAPVLKLEEAADRISRFRKGMQVRPANLKASV